MRVGSVDLGCAGTGSVLAMGEEVQFIGDVVFGQGLRKQQGILDGNGGVVHRMPQEKRRQPS